MNTPRLLAIDPAASLASHTLLGQRPSLAGWMALLSRRGAAGRIVAIVTLALVLAGAVVWLALPSPHRHMATPRWGEMIGLSQLPGAPEGQEEAASPRPEPLLGEQAAERNAQAPFATFGPPASAFHFTGAPADRMRARACLAAAMLYEAGDDAVGQLAVGQVILNRVRHPAFVPSVCGVVTQGSDRATGCQFTFTCDGSLDRSFGMPARVRAMAHADMMLDGMVFAGVGLATHYHTANVYPWWSPRLEKIARIGGHLFFRWPGYWGSARVLSRKGGDHEPSARLFWQFGGGPDLSTTDRDQAPRSQSLPTDIVDKALMPPPRIVDRTARSSEALAVPIARRLSGNAAPVGQSLTAVQGGPVLGGNRVLRMFPEEGIFYLEVAAGTRQGAVRRVADQLCGGRAECHVYGWRKASLAPQRAQIDPVAQEALVFTFHRVPAADPRARPATATAL